MTMKWVIRIAWWKLPRCLENKFFMENNEKIRLITEPTSVDDFKKIAEERFGDMVKAVVDIEKEIMAVGGEMHADEESFLLDNESAQENLWGINLYPDDFNKTNFVEFDSMINIRPRQGNRSRGVDNIETQKRILEIVGKLVK